ncbi:hypothetical protein ACOMHN_003227 [Nucella lapillus]
MDDDDDDDGDMTLPDLDLSEAERTEAGYGNSTTVAERLAKEVSVLVWVMTAPDTLHDRATMVRQTWGKRADTLLFFSSVSNATFPTVGLNVSEGREHLTAKTIQGFRYVYKHHFHEADWFLKVDDDTFVVMENLRYFLSEEAPRDPVYYGHHFGLVVAQGYYNVGYYSGGGGYVVSKEALRRFGERGHNSSLCKQDDAEFGKCMENLGVKTVNSTDARGRSRFHCFDAETHLSGGFPRWYLSMMPTEPESVSDYPITFHYIYPGKMQRLEFLIYHLRAHGLNRGFQNLNVPPSRRVSIKPIYRLPPYAPVAAPRIPAHP